MSLRHRVEDLELAVLALAVQEFGDSEGHPFRGNQHTGATGTMYAPGRVRYPDSELTKKRDTETERLRDQAKTVSSEVDYAHRELDAATRAGEDVHAAAYRIADTLKPEAREKFLQSVGL